MSLRYLNFVATFILIVLIIYILTLGKSLLIPLAISLVFWYIIIRLTATYQRVPFFQWHMPYGLALGLAIITGGVVLYAFFSLLGHSISNVINEGNVYQSKLQNLLIEFNNRTGNRMNISQIIEKINITNLFSHLALLISLSAKNFILILIYMFFLLLEHRTFNLKLKAMCHSNRQYRKIRDTIDKINQDVNTYLKVKTFINLIAGVLSYCLLRIFHINYAEFWGVFIFLLHFIPFIGPVVAVILVMLAASIQITNLPAFIILWAVLTLIQFAVGNLLEPRWMGTRLNLSPMVILLSLAFWGAVWGIIGMFLCVPIMVIVNIILAKFSKTRPLSIILSAEGQVDLK